MLDALIIGGGVIGLSLAYELAGYGLAVRVIDRREPGRESSWAGAGILPPAGRRSGASPLEELAALSNELHARWAGELARQTGVDNGYRRCGALYLAFDDAEAAELTTLEHSWRSQSIECQWLGAPEMHELEPNLLPAGSLRRGLLVPEEAQIRNPRHLRALMAACTARGVQIDAHLGCEGFELAGDRVRAVRTAAGPLAAKNFCITSGAWSQIVSASLGAPIRLRPIRGQIVLFATTPALLKRIVNVGRRYLVPRDDGRVLAGSTEEDVGFDRQNTACAVEELTEFATGLVPALATATVERTWAGLRPASQDGLPFLGRIPGVTNAFVAAGHYRNGLQLSTGTAIVLSALMRGVDPLIDAAAFRVDRPMSPIPLAES